MIVINGEGLVLGRLGSFVAKKVLEGEQVAVLNCEKVVVTGKPEEVYKENKKKIHLGSPRWGPFIPRHPYLYVKRSFRGMLPWKSKRGREAFARIKCYNKFPKEFEGKPLVSIPNAHASGKSITVAEICKMIGAKK